MTSRLIKKRLKKFIFVLLSALFTILTSAAGKPTLPFSLPSSFGLPTFNTFQKYIEKKQTEQMKTYSGRRLDANSLRMIYYNDQTVAIVELGPEKLLLSCELIEIYNDKEGVALLHKLAQINRPFEIGFKDMQKLMKQCELVDRQHEQLSKRRATSFDPDEDGMDVQGDQPREEMEEKAGFFGSNPFSLLSGVFPGTKWCGTGDIAKDFHDLGTDSNLDRCCRIHDICPTKIRAYQNRYDLINNSIYTKSHCQCDDQLYSCLKSTNTTNSQLMGSIYFNVVQVPCLEFGEAGKLNYRKAKEF